MTIQSENVATPDDVTASEAVTTTTPAPGEPTDPLARLSLELLAELRAAMAVRDGADRALADYLSLTVVALERAVSDAVTDLHGATTDLHVNELSRHLPGLAPAIRLLWAHVIDARLDRVGLCRTDGGMMDP